MTIDDGALAVSEASVPKSLLLFKKDIKTNYEEEAAAGATLAYNSLI